ncbi:TIR-like protein FxsC [Dactylosporangium sp. CS-047395]|uniref:TIR-like protein FxsC n=1 Tax=Dactylosporangium sp. CS-047395 TaxID=3239936 RepID=UPI003D8AE804
MLYFFLSYARGTDDLFVRRFYDDLCNEVRAHAGARQSEEVGFFDLHNIDPGQHWPQALIEAIAECRCFLALYSPAYFLSRPCGKEWTLFGQRSAGEDNPRVQGLVPIVWLPPRELPEVARSLHYGIDVPEVEYHRHGLRQLLRLERLHDAYNEFLTNIAEHIVDIADRAPPTGLLAQNFELLDSAFHQPGSGSGATLHFVVAAPTRPEAEAIERDGECYGTDPLHWSPFGPGQPLKDQAQRIASEFGLEASFSGLDQLADRIKAARQHNHIVVLLVDPWSFDVAAHRDMLREYDRHREHVSAVLVVMSETDAQTQAHGSRLADLMHDVLTNSERRLGEVMSRRSVNTGQSFEADLTVVLAEARNRRVVDGQVSRRRPPGKFPPRPMLEGP